MSIKKSGIINKFLVFTLCLAFFAVPLSAQTGDTIFTQTYSFAEVEDGIQSANLADDFTPDYSGDIRYVVIWMLYSGTQPDKIFLKITEDNGDIDPNTATTIISGVFPATHVDTGDDKWGFDVIQTTCTLSGTASASTSNNY